MPQFDKRVFLGEFVGHSRHQIFQPLDPLPFGLAHRRADTLSQRVSRFRRPRQFSSWLEDPSQWVNNLSLRRWLCGYTHNSLTDVSGASCLDLVPLPRERPRHCQFAAR